MVSLEFSGFKTMINTHLSISWCGVAFTVDKLAGLLLFCFGLGVDIGRESSITLPSSVIGDTIFFEDMSLKKKRTNIYRLLSTKFKNRKHFNFYLNVAIMVSLIRQEHITTSFLHHKKLIQYFVNIVKNLCHEL